MLAELVSLHCSTSLNKAFAMDPAHGFEYPLVLGSTVLADDEPFSYVSMRYDFKPASAAGPHASGMFSREREQVPPPPPPPLRAAKVLTPASSLPHRDIFCRCFHKTLSHSLMAHPLYAGDVSDTKQPSRRCTDDF